MSERLVRSAALGFALAAVLLSIRISIQVYERLPHIEDEFAFLWQAHVMAEGEIAKETPPLASSFIVPFVIDHEGQRFGKYPPGWPALLSIGVRLGAPWLIQALLWGGVVWLTFRLGEKLSSPIVGLLAAGLTLSSPMVLMLAGSLMSHGLSSLLSLSFLLSYLDLNQTSLHIKKDAVPTWLLILVAGSSLGLLLLARPLTAVGVALPMVIYSGYRFLMGTNHDRRVNLALAALVLLIGSTLLLWQAALSGNPTQNLYSLWWPYDRIGFGAEIGVTESGHNLYWALYNTRFSLQTGMHDLFGWPWLSWIFLPFGMYALRRQTSSWLSIGVFPALILVYGLYWVGSWLFGPRYYVESLPVLAVISAAGFAWLVDQRWVGARLRVIFPSVLLLVLVILNAVCYLPARIGGKRGLYQITRMPMQVLDEAGLEPALIAVRAERWFEYARYLLLAPPFRDSELLIAWSISPEQDQRLMEAYPDWPIYLHDPDQVGVFLELQRP
jgi:hypothetical protein